MDITQFISYTLADCCIYKKKKNASTCHAVGTLRYVAAEAGWK